jgi:site-specific DNA-methyltransferase (adenine-specific)
MDSMGMLAYEWSTRRWFMWARQHTVEGGHMAVFTDWRMSPWVQLMLELAGWRLTNLVVWDKGYAGLGTGFRAQHEFVIVATNGEPKWYSYDHGNVLGAMRLTQTQHPHQKPESILRRIIETCAPVNGVVADPFMGSGSSLVAAKGSQRQAIGFDIDERYCEIAAQRLAQGVLSFADSDSS